MEHLLSSLLNGNRWTQGEELGTQITDPGVDFLDHDLTQGIDNVKIDDGLTFGMPKKVFS